MLAGCRSGSHPPPAKVSAARMIFHFEDLNRSTCETQPACCRDCGWWQGHDHGWPEAGAGRWQKSAEADAGRWGKLATGDGDFLGLVQFGPAPLFPRARELPGGPVTSGAFLLTCGLAADDNLAPVLRSLVLTLLAELEAAGTARVEAWGRESGGDDDCRFFPRDFLAGCGFSPLRRSRGLVLMGMDLKTLVRVRPLPVRRRRLLERLRRTAPAPTPLFSVAPEARCHERS